MNIDSMHQPSCFGDLHTVFPLQSNGFRMSPAACLQCGYKTDCLRTALGRKNGLAVQDEMIDRAYQGGLIGFLHRWSRKKTIDRMRKTK